MESVNRFGPLLGRVLMANIFLISGFWKISGFAGTSGYIASKGIPMSFQFYFIGDTALASSHTPSRTKMYCLRRSLVAALFHLRNRIGIRSGDGCHHRSARL